MRLSAVLLVAAALPAAFAAELRYWIEPCTRPETACREGDPQLAEWAFEAWEGASAGRLTLVQVKQAEEADLRIHWAGAREGLYGETRGGDIWVRPTIVPAGERDQLLRDAVVYLTCLHESGHALGLPHTAAFADIMYSFQYGGDLKEYFGRYRRKLTRREDIARQSALSEQDRSRLRGQFK